MRLCLDLSARVDFDGLQRTPLYEQDQGDGGSREELYVNMAEVRFFTPAGLAGLHQTMMSAVERGRQLVVTRPKNYSAFQHAQRMQLFKDFSVFTERAFQAHEPGSRFVELAQISRDWGVRGNQVERVCCDLADVVAPDDAELKDILRFCVSEMVSNVCQHSGATGVLCAQYYPICDNMVDIAIVDHGIGLRQGLCGNADYDWIKDDEEALALAIRPDTSGTFNRPIGPYEDVVNTGNGLYYLTQIVARSFGYLEIWTGSARLFQDGKEPPLITRAGRSFTGTLISFRMPRGMAPALAEQIASIRKATLAVGFDDETDILFED